MNVSIRIDRLVLDGVAAVDAERLRAAIERALIERLRADPTFAARVRGGALRLAGGRFAVDPDATSEAVGERIAAQIASAPAP